MPKAPHHLQAEAGKDLSADQVHADVMRHFGAAPLLGYLSKPYSLI